MTGPAAFADPSALRHCWHPVAFGTGLTDKPAHADLLGEPLVLWRGADGQPAELHLKFDAVAVAYRTAMHGCGLARL